jgi:hypothetical protein
MFFFSFFAFTGFGAFVTFSFSFSLSSFGLLSQFLQDSHLQASEHLTPLL